MHDITLNVKLEDDVADLIASGDLSPEVLEKGSVELAIGSYKVIIMRGKTYIFKDKSKLLAQQAEVIKHVEIPVMRRLARFSDRTLKPWLYEWVVATDDYSKMSNQVQLFVFFSLLGQVADNLAALANIANRAVAVKSSSSLLGPITILSRNQLESYWTLAFILQDDTMRAERCAAYFYAHLQVLKRHNLRRIEEQNAPNKQDQIDAEEQRVDDATHDPCFDQAKAMYDGWKNGTVRGKQVRATNKPEWYKLCGLSSIYEVADKVNDADAYRDQYDYWSAVAHSMAPSIGEVSGLNHDTNTFIMNPQFEMVTGIVSYAISYSHKLFALIVDKVTSDHKGKWKHLSSSLQIQLEAAKASLNRAAAEHQQAGIR